MPNYLHLTWVSEEKDDFEYSGMSDTGGKIKQIKSKRVTIK